VEKIAMKQYAANIKKVCNPRSYMVYFCYGKHAKMFGIKNCFDKEMNLNKILCR